MKAGIFVFLVGVVGFSVAKQLPKYIKKCSLSDPNKEQCFIKHGYEAIPSFIKGDKSFNVPSLSPLKIEKVNFNAGSLKVFLTDMSVYGLENVRIINVGIVPENKKMFFNLVAPDVTIKSHYKTKGRILLLPIEGDGPLTINLKDGEYNCTAYFDNFSFDATEPVKFVDSKVVFYVKDSHYNFENLFNGNKAIGDNVNKVLNENHDALNTEFNEVFAETINSVVKALTTGVVNDVYFKDAFDP